MWLLPVAFPQAEDSPDKKPNTDSPFIVPKAGAGWTCFDNPNCWEWACAEVIRGGCLRYEQKCTCTHEGGGGGPSYSPPTISHTFNCSIPGWGDWCIGSLSIELTASDPQNASLIISGDVNGHPSTGSGQVFTCTENPCTIDLSEGAGTVNYKVDASTGLSDSDSTTYYVDVTTPQIDGSISGTSGTLGWFVTQTFITATASDPSTGSGQVSGVFSLEVNVDNAGYMPYADTTFSDGVHTIQYRAYDNVFTTSVTVTPIASDSGSGINKIEASVDNGIWTVINSPLFFADGNHSYQIRVTDNAGNVTETPIQSLYIDASPAVIAMLDDALMLGDGLFYSIEDSQSGLSELRVVIKDNDGKYKSITWVENLDRANKYKDSVWWDGIFPSNTLGTGADGTYPTPGIYYIALKVTNGAGVETIRTATIEVPVVKTAAQENLPALVLPPSLTEETTAAPQAVQPSAPQAFGNISNPFTGNSIQTSFSANSTTTPTQSTSTSNVLWGGAAAAMLGATLAEWQKRREEEAARLAALRNSGGGEEGDSDAADKKRMKVLARVNPAYARSLAKEQSTRAAIAKVTAQELKGTNISVAQAQARQQAQWDANGQAIYAANQQFKETYGKEMDAATREQAIKDATVNGVFNAGLYSVNLNTAQAKLEEADTYGAWLEKQEVANAAILQVSLAAQQKAEEAARQNALGDFREGERGFSVEQGGIQYDLTSWMPLVINRNLESPELDNMRFFNSYYGGTGPWLFELLGPFRSLNTGGGKWDIKLEMKEEFKNGIGDEDAAIILCSNSGNCRWVDYSVAGNILYGATAADVGVPRGVSKLAGGYLEIKENTVNWDNWRNLCEDPYDTKAVEFGYYLYESAEGNITEEAFREALTDEILNSLQPPPKGFIPPFEAQPQSNTYPADKFDQPEEQGKP